jgi:hypothetical protein
LVLTLLGSAGCTTYVIPPTHPSGPATVYLTDYGRHSSVLLPTAQGDLDEYAYGDWNFWAIERTPRWWHGLRALFGSPQATLAWRRVPAPVSDAELLKILKCDRLMKFEVDGARARELSDRLHARYKASPTTSPVFSSYSNMYHVKDDELYWGCHNCNHATKQWLQALGCDVRGMAVL